jgi:chaperonin GroEL
MAQEQRDNRILLNPVYEKLLEGAQAVYDAVTVTYGPKGRNVLIEKPYGRPILTRDGVTVARDVYFKDRAKNMAAQLIIEASQTTNRLAGDGTTATVALTYHLIKKAVEMVGSGKNAMDVRDVIIEDSKKLLDALEAIKMPVSNGQLIQVASVSAGDENLGRLIAEAVEYVGSEGGLVTERSHQSGVVREYVDGYYLQQNFYGEATGRVEISKPIIVSTARKISSNGEFIEFVNRVVAAAYEAELLQQDEVPRIAFFGEIGGQALESLVANIRTGKLNAVVIPTPSTGDMGSQYLEDIAFYSGGRALAAGDNVSNIDSSYIGSADKIVCTPYTVSIFGGHHKDDLYSARLEEIKTRIEAEESDALVEKLKDRLAKMNGRIAVFKIGGTTDTEIEEKEFRIEDAIQATKAAAMHGIVPGGGVTLLRLSQTPGISDLTRDALQNVFKRLVSNANLSPDVTLNTLLPFKQYMGINLRTGKLVDMIKDGVLDPALVVEQIISNAASIASSAITIDLMILFEDKKSA